MAELLPCPFCGGEARVERIGHSGYFYVSCNTAYCCDIGKADTEAEAIAAWNTRAERTCFADEVTHRDCKYSVNRGWRERTCECIVEYAKSPLDGKTIVLHRCSSCNELMRQHMNYCPNCGAKVVEP